MARPPLPIGTHGSMKVTQLGTGAYRARARYRDYDGATRIVERTASSKTGAENALREAFRDRGRMSRHGEITPDTKVSAVADMWLRDIDESDRAVRTKVTYRELWERYLDRAIGQLRVRDVRVSTVDKVVRTIRERHGAGRATHAKVVLSGLLGLAVRHDALEDNPVRELTPAPRKRNSKQITLTETSVAELRQHLDASEVANQYDIVDLVDVLSGLGCRIGELLALDWSKLDFKAGTIEIAGTVIRVPGQGLVVQPHTKTRAGVRTVPPPAWVMDILRRRHEDGLCEWVFPSTRQTLRDAENTRKYLRRALACTQWEGLHPHSFRHFVATRLDEAGLTARQIADYLGHDHISTTQEVYMDRGVVGVEAGQALAEIVPAPPKTVGKR